MLTDLDKSKKFPHSHIDQLHRLMDWWGGYTDRRGHPSGGEFNAVRLLFFFWLGSQADRKCYRSPRTEEWGGLDQETPTFIKKTEKEISVSSLCGCKERFMDPTFSVDLFVCVSTLLPQHRPHAFHLRWTQSYTFHLNQSCSRLPQHPFLLVSDFLSCFFHQGEVNGERFISPKQRLD